MTELKKGATHSRWLAAFLKISARKRCSAVQCRNGTFQAASSLPAFLISDFFKILVNGIRSPEEIQRRLESDHCSGFKIKGN